MNLICRLSKVGEASAGSLPKQKDVEGIWTGRCYSASSPRAAYGAFLFAQTTPSVPPIADGPLFPAPQGPSLHYVIGGYADKLPAPDAFDRLTPEFHNSILRLKEDPAFVAASSAVVEGAFVSEIPANLIRFRLRQSGSYLVTESIALTDAGPFKKDSTSVRCYFFAKSKSGSSR